MATPPILKLSFAARVIVILFIPDFRTDQTYLEPAALVE